MEIRANTHGLESQLCCVLFARCWEIAWPLILDYNKWKHLLLYKLKKGVLHILLIRSHILYVLSPNRIFTLCKESLCLQIKKKSKTIIWFRTLNKWIKKRFQDWVKLGKDIHTYTARKDNYMKLKIHEMVPYCVHCKVGYYLTVDFLYL